MSRLAREELRHFEQVLKLLKHRSIPFKHLAPSQYAANLHQHIQNHEPDRLVDGLIVGAIIEARSCERFSQIIPLLEQEGELQAFYQGLLASEARHFEVYLALARRYAKTPIQVRVDELLRIEASYIQGEDDLFRFHSGVPSI